MGFDPANFVTPDCEDKVGDIEFCDGLKECIDMTREDCLRLNKETPCAKEVYNDCQATCGLYGSAITAQDDWPECKVIEACTDSSSSIHLLTDDGFEKTGITCQDLEVNDCRKKAKTSLDYNEIKLGYEWCNNYCGYIDKALRSKLTCTARPHILPSGSPSVSPITSKPTTGRPTTPPSRQPTASPTSP